MVCWGPGKETDLEDLAKEMKEAQRNNERLFSAMKSFYIGQPNDISIKEKDDNQKDMVNHPDHYFSENGLETIKIIEAILGKEGALYYCWGNVTKYISRWKKKGGLEDLKKAKWYLSRMIGYLEPPHE